MRASMRVQSPFSKDTHRLENVTAHLLVVRREKGLGVAAVLQKGVDAMEGQQRADNSLVAAIWHQHHSQARARGFKADTECYAGRTR